MNKTMSLILCGLLLCDFADATYIPDNDAFLDKKTYLAEVPDMSIGCGDHYMRTGKTVEIYTESGHHKGTYSVWLSKGDKYIKFNNEWIRIEGKSRFIYHGNAYVIK